MKLPVGVTHGFLAQGRCKFYIKTCNFMRSGEKPRPFYDQVHCRVLNDDRQDRAPDDNTGKELQEFCWWHSEQLSTKPTYAFKPGCRLNNSNSTLLHLF